ncbi:McrB family protein [Hymenobacter actinosclerus]|nr:AAA family ATPase [Hymenobacter actinosclerus]
MGRFNKNAAGRQLLDAFREKGWLVVNKHCPDNQGQLFMTGIQNGDYVYSCAGSVQLWGIYRVEQDWADLPVELADLITDSKNWIYRQAKIIAVPVREDLQGLNKHLSWWAPSGYRTVALVNNLTKANVDLFEPYFALQLVPGTRTKPIIQPMISARFPNPNIILYGPPGTGKTRSTLELAYEILTGKQDYSYADAQKLFQEELGNRLEFVTFHQSFTYEDFVQGFRPKVIKGQMVFEKSDGVFYRIAQRARQEMISGHSKAKSSKVEAQELIFTPDQPLLTPFEQALHQLVKGPKDSNGYVFVSRENAKFPVTVDFVSRTVSFRRGLKQKAKQDKNVSFTTLNRWYNDQSNVPNPNGTQLYYQYIAKRLRELSKQPDNTSPATTISDFEQSESEQQNTIQNYVLIIDEINRANIARVFGELITLLEKDKRLGGSNTLPVTLPSGEQGFTVPANLYLIGTMNTADRSLALLDIALRRRFEFRPLYPRYDVFGKMKDDRKDTLQKLNAEIVRQKSRDFQIGHAYFLDPEESLESIFNGKVIPLLYEYFLNDEPKVQALLRTAGVTTHVDQSVGLRYGPAGPATR